MARATKSRGYTSPQRQLDSILRRNLSITSDMTPPEIRVHISKVHGSVRYQRALRAKFELDFIRASGNIGSTTNDFVYSLYRAARSTLKASDRLALIDALVEKGKEGRHLKSAEELFIIEVRAFIADSKDSANVLDRDSKMFNKIISPRLVPVIAPLEADTSRAVPITLNLKMAEEAPLARHASQMVGSSELGTIQTRWFSKFLVSGLAMFTAACVAVGATGGRFISFMGEFQGLEHLVTASRTSAVVYPPNPNGLPSGSIVIDAPQWQVDQASAKSGGRPVYIVPHPDKLLVRFEGQQGRQPAFILASSMLRNP